MSEITITHSDEDGLTYVEPPDFEHEVGDRFYVDEVIKLSSQEESVLYYEITDRSMEYVVNEREWYVWYEVSFHDYHKYEVFSDKLSPEDIANDGFEKTDMSPLWMQSRAESRGDVVLNLTR